LVGEKVQPANRINITAGAVQAVARVGLSIFAIGPNSVPAGVLRNIALILRSRPINA
jgi:hypothetical protein